MTGSLHRTGLAAPPVSTLEAATTRRAKKPNFLYIGMPKAGSTWIFEMLRQHPDVYVPPAKDIKYFDDNYHRGGDWYLKFFEGAKGETAIGELSHDYYAVPEAAERIHRDLPDVKLICCLREPGDFAASAFRYARMHSLEGTENLEAYTEHLRLNGYLQYLENLERFFHRFPETNIKVIFYENIKDDPAGTLAELYRFLGVREDMLPPDCGRRINATRQPRSMTLTRLAYSIAQLLRRVGLTNLLGLLKKSGLTQNILYQPIPETVPTDPRVLDDLRARWRADFASLEALIGKPLPAAWHRPA